MQKSKVSAQEYLTYDDVLLRPRRSAIIPAQANIQGQFSRRISLKVPLISSAMDTVTEAPMAIAMAQLGGLGVIHKNMAKEKQAHEVERVKKYESGLIVDPVTVTPDTSLHEVKKIARKNKITGVPVISANGELQGILTRRDIQFEDDDKKTVQEVMTSRDRLVTGLEGIGLEEAKSLMHKNRIEKLPIVDSKGFLKGLVTLKDIRKSISFPDSTKDERGRLRVAAAVGVGDKELARAEALVKAGVDAIVIDTAHGHSEGVMLMLDQLKKTYGETTDIVAGNVATKEACLDLIGRGVDGLKIGIGPGSICTTRVVAGIGVPQLSAILECAQAASDNSIPLIADGGVKYSGDIVKALAAGASCVMLGSLFAGTDETPGEMVLYQGRSYKLYRGMGSLGAMVLGSKDRYGQGEVKDLGKLVPEGIEGQVPYRGPLSATVFQLVGGLRSGMGYLGASNLEVLRENANFIKISASSLRESHPHDVTMTKDAPNYSGK